MLENKSKHKLLRMIRVKRMILAFCRQYDYKICELGLNFVTVKNDKHIRLSAINENQQDFKCKIDE